MPIAALTMLDDRNPVVWLIGITAFAFAFFFLRAHFNDEARARRRLEKSNRPVISRKKGPTVRLAVDVDKLKRTRKRGRK